jgi:hypothetical protein
MVPVYQMTKWPIFLYFLTMYVLIEKSTKVPKDQIFLSIQAVSQLKWNGTTVPNDQNTNYGQSFITFKATHVLNKKSTKVPRIISFSAFKQFISVKEMVPVYQMTKITNIIYFIINLCAYLKKYQGTKEPDPSQHLNS